VRRRLVGTLVDLAVDHQRQAFLEAQARAGSAGELFFDGGGHAYELELAQLGQGVVHHHVRVLEFG
jgi:hypothetical protein